MSNVIEVNNNDEFVTKVINSTKPVLVDFWAEWCGPCKQLAPLVEEASEEFKDSLSVCKMDVDNNRETAAKYGIRSIPTLMIFENGELDFLPKAVVNEFLKNRFNNSLESIGIEKVFDIDEDLVAQTEWFDDEIIGTKHGDFFVKRSINYSKRSQSITSDDLF